METAILSRENFGALFESLNKLGYSIVGPTIKDGAIIYDRLQEVSDLPIGWTDEQTAGKYRLERRTDEALFGYNVGPHSWKKYLFPPRRRLWKANRDGKTLKIETESLPEEKLAFLGVRACEIQAILVQDKVFQGGTHKDPYYQTQRARLIVIAANCTEAGGTCFCVSMKTGPRCTKGFDLVITEILEASRHEFVLEAGTPTGQELLAHLPV
ncbi:MAG: sulfite reductase subunit A, partial [Deltaproteobacteria bacterium]|nr:sulfite reductase subunit A [Deltaproteobacteria bacterium]